MEKFGEKVLSKKIKFSYVSIEVRSKLKSQKFENYISNGLEFTKMK